MEVGQTGGAGVPVSVITPLEQELGTELDRVPTQFPIAMAGINSI